MGAQASACNTGDQALSNRLWLLGADDPEMRAIENLLHECGERVAHALDANGARVVPSGMYLAAGPWPAEGTEATYLVECAWAGVGSVPKAHGRVVQIDHHRPGDVGFGRPPAEFLQASSLGQVVAELARLGVLPKEWKRTHQPQPGTPDGCFLNGIDRTTWMVREAESVGGRAVYIPAGIALIAAADHCLGAAYKGECPGVAPADLLEFRIHQRAVERWHQAGGALGTLRLENHIRRVRYDIETTREALKHAPGVELFRSEADRVVAVADMRREGEPWPELPEAACSGGVGYVAGPIQESLGRRKLVCSGSPTEVAAFIRWWAPAQKLTDIYGTPTRGFAGGYLP